MILILSVLAIRLIIEIFNNINSNPGVIDEHKGIVHHPAETPLR